MPYPTETLTPEQVTEGISQLKKIFSKDHPTENSETSTATPQSS